MIYRLYTGDCVKVLRGLPAACAHTCITSPPYFGLRDYGMPGQIGLEPTPNEYVVRLVEVFREVRRVLRDDGTLWLILGDSYAGTSKNTAFGLKRKDLIGVPWRAAFALQADGWYLRQDLIWHKPNSMPESVRDRCTSAHEYMFMLAKSAQYYYDGNAMREPAITKENRSGKGKYHLDKSMKARGLALSAPDGKRNRRSVWSVGTRSFPGAHFATFPPELIEPCILAGCPEGGVVLDPFNGAGTAGTVALRNARRYIGIELNPMYVQLSEQRIKPYALEYTLS